MSFMIYSTDDGHMPAWEYLPAGAITPKVGLALTQTAGNLTIASGATKPDYICMREEDGAVTAGTLIPVIKVTPDIIFETQWSAAAGSIKRGGKVTLASDGLRVTATTTDGVAFVSDIVGIAAGDAVRVRFN